MSSMKIISAKKHYDVQSSEKKNNMSGSKGLNQMSNGPIKAHQKVTPTKNDFKNPSPLSHPPSRPGHDRAVAFANPKTPQGGKGANTPSALIKQAMHNMKMGIGGIKHNFKALVNNTKSGSQSQWFDQGSNHSSSPMNNMMARRNGMKEGTAGDVSKQNNKNSNVVTRRNGVKEGTHSHTTKQNNNGKDIYVSMRNQGKQQSSSIYENVGKHTQHHTGKHQEPIYEEMDSIITKLASSGKVSTQGPASKTQTSASQTVLSSSAHQPGPAVPPKKLRYVSKETGKPFNSSQHKRSLNEGIYASPFSLHNQQSRGSGQDSSSLSNKPTPKPRTEKSLSKQRSNSDPTAMKKPLPLPRTEKSLNKASGAAHSATQHATHRGRSASDPTHGSSRHTK